jgi:restriction endonuclease S subunit
MLSYSPYANILLKLIADWQRSPWQRGELTRWVSVNPPTEIPALAPDSIVSFVPMESVGEKDGQVRVQEALYEAVAKGYTRFREGDLLWAKITPCMQNGKAAIVRNLRSGIGFGSTEFHVLRPNSGEVSTEFLWNVFTLDRFLMAAQAAFTGSAGQQRVAAEFIKGLPIPIPPPDVQASLVAEVERARLIRQNKVIQADELLDGLDDYLLKQLGLLSPTIQKESLSHVVRVKDVMNSRYDPHFHSPRFHRLVASLREITTAPLGEIVGFSQEIWNSPKIEDTTFCYIEISSIDIRTRDITPTELTVAKAPSRARMLVRRNDILVSLTRPHRGAISIIPENLDQCVASTGFSIIREVDKKRVHREYLLFVLRSKLCLDQMLQRSSGGSYPAITEEELAQIRVPLPSGSVQQAIVDEARRRFGEAQQLRSQANLEWASAKARFERKLLGEEA